MAGQSVVIVTLLTDFGITDYFVAAMKGAVLSHSQGIRIVDLTHDVPRHDITAAAFQLSAVYSHFPAGTVHIVVVDPGVGSPRRPIAIRAGDYFFVGPDNGVFGFVLAREKDVEIRRIESPALQRKSVGRTFHGRDIFAPAGAALAAGYPFSEVGAVVEDPVPLALVGNERSADGGVVGRILHVDRFGNCVTSFRPEDLSLGANAYRIKLAGAEVDEVRAFYASGDREWPFAIWGSAGYLEIAFDRASAAERLGVVTGARVEARVRDG